jgi:uncharacterized membrane protein
MPPESLPKRVIRLLSAAAMAIAGVAHFVAPGGFVKIVPAYLPAPLLLVYVSGFFEIAGALGLLVTRVQRIASYGLIALYIAVFPANVNMAVHDIQPAAQHIPESVLWARLPFQLLFIAIAWWLSRSGPRARDPEPR